MPFIFKLQAPYLNTQNQEQTQKSNVNPHIYKQFSFQSKDNHQGVINYASKSQQYIQEQNFNDIKSFDQSYKYEKPFNQMKISNQVNPISENNYVEGNISRKQISQKNFPQNNNSILIHAIQSKKSNKNPIKMQMSSYVQNLKNPWYKKYIDRPYYNWNSVNPDYWQPNWDNSRPYYQSRDHYYPGYPGYPPRENYRPYYNQDSYYSGYPARDNYRPYQYQDSYYSGYPARDKNVLRDYYGGQPGYYQTVNQENHRQEFLFKTEIADLINCEWSKFKNFLYPELRKTLFYTIQQDPQYIQGKFDPIQFESKREIIFDDFIKRKIDPEIQRVQKFLIDAFIETLDKRSLNQIYEPYFLQNKQPFLQEITDKNKCFQDLIEKKVIQNAQKGQFLDFEQIFLQNSKVDYVHPFQCYISPITQIKDFSTLPQNTKILKFFESTPNFKRISEPMKTWLSLQPFSLAEIERFLNKEKLDINQQDQFAEKRLDNKNIQGFFNTKNEISIFRIYTDANSLFEGVGNIDGYSYGRYIFQNGDYYVGEFLNGIHHGWGEYRNASSSSIQLGNWKKGILQ